MSLPPFGSPPLPAQTGSSGKYLTTNGTTPSWGTISSGGQSPYDAIVASSGGDYTTLSAAITAASAGWKILVRAGTYTEAGVTSALTDLVIEGEGIGQTILACGANSITLSGANLILRDIGFTASTGTITCSGADPYIQNVYLSKTSTGNGFMVTGTQPRVIGCKIISTNTTAGASQFTFRSTSDKAFIAFNHFEGGATDSSANVGAFAFSAGLSDINNNYFVLTSTDNNTFISLASANMTFRDNIVDFSTAGTTGSMIDVGGGPIVINNNIIKSSNQVALNIRTTRATIDSNNITGKFPINFAADSSYATIVGNTIRAVAGGTHIAFNNNTSLWTTINGNNLSTGATGISLGATDSYNTITNNSFDATGFAITTPISDSGVGNTIMNNSGLAPRFSKRFMLMKNTSGGALANGDVVVFKAVAAGDEVTTTVTGGDNKVWGIAVEAIGSTSYGMIQVEGFTNALKADGTTDIAIGDFLTPFTTAKIAQKAAVGQTVFAIALEAYTTNDSSGVLDALIIPPRLI